MAEVVRPGTTKMRPDQSVDIARPEVITGSRPTDKPPSALPPLDLPGEDVTQVINPLGPEPKGPGLSGRVPKHKQVTETKVKFPGALYTPGVQMTPEEIKQTDQAEAAAQKAESKKPKYDQYQTTLGRFQKAILEGKDITDIANSAVEIMSDDVMALGEDASALNEAKKKLHEKTKGEIQSELLQSHNDLKEEQDLIKSALADAEERQREFDAAAKRGIDPDNYFHDRSAFSKIVGAISIGLGAYSSAMTGSPNFALNIITDAINRDVEAQLKNLEFKQSAAQMGIDTSKLTIDSSIRLGTLRANERANRINSVLSLLNNENNLLDSAFKNQATLTGLRQGLGKLKLNTEIELKKLQGQEMDLEKLLRIQKLRGDITAQQQAIAQTQRATTVGPSVFARIPFLKNIPSAYLSGVDKKEVLKITNEAQSGFRAAANASKAVQQFQALSKHVKMVDKGTGAVRAVFGRHRETMARAHNEMKRRADFLIQPVRKIIMAGDPRLSEKDLDIIKGIASSKDISSFHRMFFQAGMHKLKILDDASKMLAVENMVEFYRKMETMVEIPPKVRAQIDNLLKNDEYKSSIQKTNELFNFFKKEGL